MNTTSDYAVVIPAYNEAATIRNIVQRALQQSSDVIVVNDGSVDSTSEQLEGLPVTVIEHKRNYGKAISLWDGIQEAIQRNVAAIVTIDGDGQHNPEDIPRLIEEFRKHPDHIIIGSRLSNKEDIPAKRYYANKIANFWISWASGYHISDSQSGFRVYPSKLFSATIISVTKQKSFVFESEILIKAARAGYYSRPVKIDAIYKTDARPSHFRGVTDIILITRMVAWELISHGLSLPSLYRSIFTHKHNQKKNINVGLDGYSMLLLSILTILFSAGTSLIVMITWVISVAARASSNIPHADKAIVLGMQLEQNMPNSDYKKRLKKAAMYLSASESGTLIVVGGHTSDTANISEAQAGKNFLIDLDCDPSRIIIEENSMTTLENFRMVKPLLDETGQEVLLISNRYHLARCTSLAHGFSIPHILCAAESNVPLKYWISIRILKEAFYLHWYHVGRIWARITKNKNMLERIS